MSFLYPIFLVAGLSLAIPLLIHLFNLRRYKVVYFPHTRFLKNLQLSSRKQNQVRYFWLLLARLLFLLALVLAFAKPFLSRKAEKGGDRRLQLIYLDNSYSMSAKKGARSLLDIAREGARKQVQHALPGTRFVLLTNDRDAWQEETADKTWQKIAATDYTAIALNADQVLARVQQLMQRDGMPWADVYYYSDFQQNAFPGQPEAALLKHITFYGVPVQTAEASNIYIDTAWLASPVVQAGRDNKIVIRTRCSGKEPAEKPVLNLVVNGQVKSAASLSFGDKRESTDTLGFEVAGNNWQSVELMVNDAGMRFDDTFRIAARSAPDLSVLTINEGQPNPYIQAAFRAYNGFRMNPVSSTAALPSFRDYNLVILNGVTRIEDALGNQLNEALQQGQSICIFPGRTRDLAGLNTGLKKLGDLELSGLDTEAQTVASLQPGSPLLRDLFDRIPENIQLPVANWHYLVRAGLNANQQSVLSFRNGDPFFASYMPGTGRLYLCATSADLAGGNFPASYFFTPFLFEMAMQSTGSSIYALTAGSGQPVFLPVARTAGRAELHIYGPHLDVIPPQRPNGPGQDVFVDQSVTRPGFYAISAPGADTALVALNQDKRESQVTLRDLGPLRDRWKGDQVKWLTLQGNGRIAADDGLPLWKVCILLALVMLAAETFLLARVKSVPAV